MQHYDLIVVGAGIMGLAHAYHAARAGMSVAVFDRSAQADGASIRNFGMLAVVAQAEGKQLDDSRRALDTWKHIAPLAGIDIDQTGCLFVAQHVEELDVLAEYAANNQTHFSAKILQPSAMAQYAHRLNSNAIVGGLWNRDAWKVDQRQAMIKIASWLQHELDVVFYFSTVVTHAETGSVVTSNGMYRCGTIVVCAGNEFSTLFPDAYAASGVTQCQLQMLRTRIQPDGWRLRPFVLGGLSLPRYAAFSDCPSLPALKSLQQSKYKTHLQYGIHLIVCQEADGSITIGDSHQYTDDGNLERSEVIDQLMLNELSAVIQLPDSRITQRWIGHYAYLENTDVLKMQVEDRVLAITMTNGQGMTHSFAQAEDVISELIA